MVPDRSISKVNSRGGGKPYKSPGLLNPNSSVVEFIEVVDTFPLPKKLNHNPQLQNE